MRQQLLPVGKYSSTKIPSNGLEFLGFVKTEAATITQTIPALPDVPDAIPEDIPDDIPFSIPPKMLPYSSWHFKLSQKTRKHRTELYKLRKQSLSIKNLRELVQLDFKRVVDLGRRNCFELLKSVDEYLKSISVLDLEVGKDSSHNILEDSNAEGTSKHSRDDTKDNTSNRKRPRPNPNTTILQLLKWTFILLIYADTLVTADEMHDLRSLCKTVRKFRFDYLQEMGMDSVNEIVMGMTMIVHVIANDFGQRDLQDPFRPPPDIV